MKTKNHIRVIVNTRKMAIIGWLIMMLGLICIIVYKSFYLHLQIPENINLIIGLISLIICSYGATIFMYALILHYSSVIKQLRGQLKEMKLEKTERGFIRGDFTDKYDTVCSIQESSLATEDAIWFGVNEANPQIMVSDAIKLGIETTEKDGWCAYPVPKEVSFTTRMHLTQEMVKKLL